MRKFFIIVMTYLAQIESAQTPTPLASSLQEVQTILNASNLLAKVIPSNEFIFDIQRVTQTPEAKVIVYKLTTVVVPIKNKCAAAAKDKKGGKQPVPPQMKFYQVKLTLATSPILGLSALTVTCIKPIKPTPPVKPQT